MAEDHKVVQFELSKELKSKIQNIFYDTDNKKLDIYINKSTSLISKVDKSSMRNTLEQFDKSMDGTLNSNIKLLCVYSIKYHLRKYVKFDDAEQKWYSENYPNDPGLESKNKDKRKASDNEEDDEKTKPKKIAINKYSGNGRQPLHESVIIGETPVFVT
jgi:predicted HTH domain antitoxin